MGFASPMVVRRTDHKLSVSDNSSHVCQCTSCESFYFEATEFQKAYGSPSSHEYSLEVSSFNWVQEKNFGKMKSIKEYHATLDKELASIRKYKQKRERNKEKPISLLVLTILLSRHLTVNLKGWWKDCRTLKRCVVRHVTTHLVVLTIRGTKNHCLGFYSPHGCWLQIAKDTDPPVLTNRWLGIRAKNNISYVKVKHINTEVWIRKGEDLHFF